MSDDSTPAYIAERIRRPPPAGCPVVPGSTPVVAFGPFRSAKIATLGLNPSKREFLDKGGRELEGPQRRLATLAALGVAGLAEAPEAAIAQVLAGCDTYFLRNPYRRWFDQLQRILDPLGVSYFDGSAAHLDLVQWATDPIWRHLSQSSRELMLREDSAFLRQQLEHEQIEVLLLNGRSVIQQVEWAFNLSLQRVPERLSGRLATELVMGAGPGGCAIIGWSTNLQSSYGVTRELRRDLAAVVAELADSARASARQAAVARLAEERTQPSLKRRTVSLSGTTTIDGAEAPCSGQIRLKRYPGHMFAQWNVNRQNGTLPGHGALTIPLGDLPGGADIWGASVQLVLEQIRAYSVGGAPVFQITSWGWQAQSFDLDVVKQIIGWLTLAMEHKGMVLGGANLERFLEWEMGFAQGVSFAGLHLDRSSGAEAWWSIARQRGWHFLAARPWREMREKGMTDEQIIDELLTIEIAAWRRAYQLDAADTSA